MAQSSSTRTAVITGGAEGIGRAYAIRLAADGHDIIIFDRLAADETVAAITAAGGKARALRCELDNPAAIAQAVQDVLAHEGGCDILVNNAGIGSARPFEGVNYDQLRFMLAVNVEAPVLIIQGFLPEMRRRGWGRIVNISSGLLNSFVPGFTDYITCKGAVVGLTRGLASEYGPEGITVNAIAPGMVRTPLTTLGRPGHPPAPASTFDMALGTQSIKRPQTPEDLAAVLSFLVSDDGAFVTGQVIHADGGTVRV